MEEVLIVPTGVANLASVIAAFERLGRKTALCTGGAQIVEASRVVLPGVGTFGAAVDGLRSARLEEALVERVEAGRPTLAMCVGLQILFQASDESSDAVGLGVAQGRVGRFEGEVRVPQFGWNLVDPEPGCRYFRSGYAYFANSYRTLEAPGWRVASAEHGGRFVAGMERGDVVACQFHPELSGTYGGDLIARWLEGAGPC
jgi:glutamine amidotransferase